MELSQILGRFLIVIVVMLISFFFGKSSISPKTSVDLGTRILGIFISFLTGAMGVSEVFHIIECCRGGLS